MVKGLECVPSLKCVLRVPSVLFGTAAVSKT